MSISYRYLSPEMQLISQYLANFPGSFTLEAANAIVICGQAYPCLKNASQNDSPWPVTKTLRSLTSRSLIEFKQQRYTFHRLIMEFLREVQVSDSNKAAFNSNFQVYYSFFLTETIKIFEEDYKLGLLLLGIERHNYQQLLDDLKTKSHDVTPFLEMIGSIAASTVHILSFSFSDEEILNSTLSALQYIEENQLLQKIKYEFFRLACVTLTYESVRIEKHMFGIELQTYTRESIVDSVTPNKAKSKSTEMMVYKQLIKLHEELGNHVIAKKVHIEFLSLNRDGFQCNGPDHDKCSYFEIGEEYLLKDFTKNLPNIWSSNNNE